MGDVQSANATASSEHWNLLADVPVNVNVALGELVEAAGDPSYALDSRGLRSEEPRGVDAKCLTRHGERDPS